MAVTKMRREVLGRKKSTSCIRIKNGRVIISDPKIIAEMNSESIKKSEKQRQNDTDALAIAARLYAGY